MKSEEANLQRLAKVLKTLGSPVRLDLMSLLRTPRMVREIHLRPQGPRAKGQSMSGVVVRRHIERLIEIGVVRPLEGRRGGRRVTRYQVNHRQTFVLTEDLRALARIRAEDDTFLDGTQPGPGNRRFLESGPSLTLVNGIFEGRQFLLRGTRGHWTIGRHPSCDICLDYDPSVSLRHASIVERSGGFNAIDLPASRNGTNLNWQRMHKNVAQPLASGDLLGVGRSSLVFRSG